MINEVIRTPVVVSMTLLLSLPLLNTSHQVFLMTAIMLTGNYNFFNLITCGLVITSLDDAHLPSAATLVQYLSPISNGGFGAVAALLKLPVKLLIALVKLPYKIAVGAAQCPARCVTRVIISTT